MHAEVNIFAIFFSLCVVSYSTFATPINVGIPNEIDKSGITNVKSAT